MNSSELSKLQYAQKLLKEVADTYQTDDPFSPLDIAALSIENVIRKESKAIDAGTQAPKTTAQPLRSITSVLKEVIHTDANGRVTVGELINALNQHTGTDFRHDAKAWKSARNAIMNDFGARISQSNGVRKVFGVSFNAGI